MNLPDDYLKFLSSGAKLVYDETRCEAGLITFSPYSELFLDSTSFVVDLYNLHHPKVTESMREISGFSVPAVSLVATCEDYDPEGLIIWIPGHNAYGSWDSDHHTVGAFPPSVSWSDIEAAPNKYLNAFWGDYYDPVTGFDLILPE